MFDIISSREGLDRGDRDIGDPVEEELDIEDIPEEATDVLRDDSKNEEHRMLIINRRMGKNNIYIIISEVG